MCCSSSSSAAGGCTLPASPTIRPACGLSNRPAICWPALPIRRGVEVSDPRSGQQVHQSVRPATLRRALQPAAPAPELGPRDAGAVGGCRSKECAELRPAPPLRRPRWTDPRVRVRLRSMTPRLLTPHEPSRFLDDRAEAERRLPARRTAGQRQRRRRRAGHHLAIALAGATTPSDLGSVLAPELAQLTRTYGRRVQRQCPQMPSRRTTPEAGRARGHPHAVPPGTAWGALAADSCGRGSAGEGATHGV
jgi:hypothetical protein